MPSASLDRRIGSPLDLAAVAAGGAIGTLLRAIPLMLANPVPGEIPWVTAGENVTGAFLLGFLTMALFKRAPEARRLHLFLATGVLGSFTTFSALAVDVVSLAQAGMPGEMLLYLTLSIPGGVAAAILGLGAGRLVGPEP